ncbi:hypothetical protein T265_09071, partial [Opisthorchis viverrini]
CVELDNRGLNSLWKLHAKSYFRVSVRPISPCCCFIGQSSWDCLSLTLPCRLLCSTFGRQPISPRPCHLQQN